LVQINFTLIIAFLQIFYLAEAGKLIEDLQNSVFVEKLHARGYEVLLLNEPLDEIMIQHVQRWK
jgi:heat shock protein beta